MGWVARRSVVSHLRQSSSSSFSPLLQPYYCPSTIHSTAICFPADLPACLVLFFSPCLFNLGYYYYYVTRDLAGIVCIAVYLRRCCFIVMTGSIQSSAQEQEHEHFCDGFFQLGQDFSRSLLTLRSTVHWFGYYADYQVD